MNAERKESYHAPELPDAPRETDRLRDYRDRRHAITSLSQDKRAEQARVDAINASVVT